MTKIKKISPFMRAVKLVGSQEEFAARIGVTQQAVSKMLKRGILSPNYVLLAEKATNGQVTRHQLRPDLYPQD